MPGTNLTREEAQIRADLLAVESYRIDLDLTVSDKVFESTTVLRFTCTEPGASSFADLVGATVHEVVLNGGGVGSASDTPRSQSSAATVPFGASPPNTTISRTFGVFLRIEQKRSAYSASVQISNASELSVT